MNNVVVFKASKKKAVLVLFGSICFVAIGVWISAANPFLGWSCAVFFSLGIVAAALMLLPNAMYLRLDETGFEMGSLFRKHRTQWTDVDGFAISSIHGAKMIAISYSSRYKKQQIARAMAASLAGMEGAIPNSYTVSLDHVLKALNIWRERFGADSSNAQN